ncbi:uncharacterized protein LOC106172656 isoform X1 [Lingula anatina]|uniref:Uncharacterized protein LOC106172656 isoform X1 n=1 Tax=Lingula anatina TaxID=7574 RepID=A0A1S3JEY8_LINAN|nr:uncharacterized protein LOC106172656 isoform X1 [Lingula anatina]|eukprot:XP_013408903.1 uncharacterized protein LOC106172656 isoform X1 [Lingula anatina]
MAIRFLVLITATVLAFSKLANAGPSYNYYDEIAQATCTAMNTRAGWVFAVRRKCNSWTLPCQYICSSPSLAAQDPSVSSRGLECFNSLHVYQDRPVLPSDIQSGTNMLGLEVYRYQSCYSGSCGPNYCCCRSK